VIVRRTTVITKHRKSRRLSKSTSDHNYLTLTTFFLLLSCLSLSLSIFFPYNEYTLFITFSSARVHTTRHTTTAQHSYLHTFNNDRVVTTRTPTRSTTMSKSRPQAPLDGGSSDNAEPPLSLYDMPAEIMERVALSAPAPTMARLRQTCLPKYFADVCGSDPMWKALAWRDFGSDAVRSGLYKHATLP
jgi:hypothetical protein